MRRGQSFPLGLKNHRNLKEPKKDAECLNKSEKKKLLIKRQKNKEAAARCRQKKIDTINKLEDAVKVKTEILLVSTK